MTLPPAVRVARRGVPERAERRAVSRALLTDLLPGASFVSRCPVCGGPHGRVRVLGADADVSVSYAEGWAFVAVASGSGRIGIDAVPAAAARLDRVLPGADARTWARVEAVLKADGRGLRVDPIRVRFEQTVPTGADWGARIDGGPPLRGWDVEGPAGVLVAVAVDATPSRHPR